jgi:predicted ester cyclase
VEKTREESNKVLALRIVESFNRGDLTSLDELITPNATGHDVDSAEQLGLPIEGSESAKQFITMFRNAFSDLSFEVEQVVAEGELVAVRAVMTATHDGQFMGLAPTGRRVQVPGVDILRFADGRVVEHWGLWDRMAMMQQLGLVGPIRSGDSG